MNHVAIDLGGRKSRICVLASNGKPVSEATVATRELGVLLSAMPASRVVMETCAESRGVARWAKNAGHDVRVIHAAAARTLGIGARGIKTDTRDARALATASCRVDLAGVHIRSEQARERQVALGMRAALVSARTQLINTVRAVLRVELIAPVRCTPETFAVKMTEVAEKLTAVSRLAMQTQLRAIGELSAAIRQADKHIKLLAENDPMCRLLMSMPGVAHKTSLCMAAIVDTTARFHSAKAFTSYIGATPGEASSSERTRRTSITKAGSSMMRSYLTQSAWCLWRTRPDEPVVLWARAIAHRRGTKVAMMALVRKIAGVLFAMMRDSTPYQPHRAVSAM